VGFDTSRTIIPRQGTPYVSQFLTFQRGVNNSTSDEIIAQDELADVRNFIPDSLNAGVLISRPGSVQTYLQTNPWTSIYQGRNNAYATTTSLIVGLQTNTTLATMTTSTAPDWTTYVGTDIFVNGVDAPQATTDGSTFAALAGSPPTFKYIERQGQHLYGAGHENGRLRWADTGTTTTWPAINELIITDDVADDITGLARFNDLVVFCEKSFHRIRHGTSEADISVAFSNYAAGCTSHRSIIVCPYGLFWWSQQGLAWTKDGMSFDLPLLRRIPKTLADLNKSKYSRVHGVYNADEGALQYFVCNDGSDTENLSIWYYPPDERFGRPESVWLMDGDGTEMGASGFVVSNYTTSIYLGAAASAGYMHLQTGTSDPIQASPGFGQPIICYLETKREVTDYGIKSQKKCTNIVLLLYSSGGDSIDYSTYVDNSTTVDRTWTTPLTLAAGDNIAIEVPIGYERSYHKIKHRLYSTAAGHTKVRGIVNSGHLVST